jgi:hypothetical protein
MKDNPTVEHPHVARCVIAIGEHPIALWEVIAYHGHQRISGIGVSISEACVAFKASVKMYKRKRPNAVFKGIHDRRIGTRIG